MKLHLTTVTAGEPWLSRLPFRATRKLRKGKTCPVACGLRPEFLALKLRRFTRGVRHCDDLLDLFATGEATGPSRGAAREMAFVLRFVFLNLS